MKPITVMITGAGAPGAPGIIKSLKLAKERKVKIIAVDASRDSIGAMMANKFFTVPSAEKDSFIGKVMQIAVKENVAVIIPLVTKELEKFAESKSLFEKKGIKVLVSDSDQLKTANNKYLPLNFCKKNGLPVPKFRLVRSYPEFERAVKDLGYPKNNVCFKPPISNGMRGFRVLSEKLDRLDALLNQKPTAAIEEFSQIRKILKKADPFPELIVMEYLPGDEYSVDALANNGKMIVAIPRLRVRIKMGISFVAVVKNDKKIISQSKRIIEGLKLNGNIGLQFKEDKNGVPKIIESNPRVQGTIVICTAAGANLVYLAVKLALGEKIGKPKPRWGIKMIRFWDEIYYDERRQPFTL